MVPKKIHYCWFGGGEKDDSFEKYLESWKKYFPGWEIIEWNESNFDVNFCEYSKQAYEKKKYAFVSDVARLKIIYEEGGIYFDTDVEVIRKFDEKLLRNGYFGEEKAGIINTGLGFAARRRNKAIKAMLDGYDDLRSLIPFIINLLHEHGLDEYESMFISEIKSSNPQFLTPCPIINTATLIKNGYIVKSSTNIDKIPVYGSEYFCAYDIDKKEPTITKNTYTIHHYNASWVKDVNMITKRMKTMLRKTIGSDRYYRIKSALLRIRR